MADAAAVMMMMMVKATRLHWYVTWHVAAVGSRAGWVGSFSHSGRYQVRLRPWCRC